MARLLRRRQDFLHRIHSGSGENHAGSYHRRDEFRLPQVDEGIHQGADPVTDRLLQAALQKIALGELICSAGSSALRRAGKD